MKRIAFFFVCALLTIGAAAQELNVGTYNIRLLTNGDAKHNDHWNQRRDIVCDIIRFQDYDAFGAQEVTNPQLLDMLERLPAYDYVGVGRDDGATAGEYSPVFYNKERFKLVEGGTFWLSETPDQVSFGWDAQCRRVCSYAHLKDRKTRRDFWFFNAHLDHIGVVARREGVKLMLQKIHDIAGDKANVVVTGDFNVNQLSEAYSTMLSTGRLEDSYTLAKTRLAPGGTFSNWDVKVFTEARIDHIFVSAGTKVDRYGILTYHYWLGNKLSDAELRAAPGEIKGVERECHTPSDHYPLQAYITFPKKK